MKQSALYVTYSYVEPNEPIHKIEMQHAIM
jgi:hypothetical protein